MGFSTHDLKLIILFHFGHFTLHLACLPSLSTNYAIFDAYLNMFSISLKRPWIKYTAKPNNLLVNLFCVLPLKFSLPQN